MNMSPGKRCFCVVLFFIVYTAVHFIMYLLNEKLSGK